MNEFPYVQPLQHSYVLFINHMCFITIYALFLHASTPIGIFNNLEADRVLLTNDSEDISSSEGRIDTYI